MKKQKRAGSHENKEGRKNGNWEMQQGRRRRNARKCKKNEGTQKT